MASSSEPGSIEHASRTLRSTGASAASPENKLRLAEAILTAPDDSCFPDRHRFILDWLCGVFKMKAAAMAPRVDVRFWRLLDMLLHLAVGTSAPDDDAAPPFPLPPLRNTATS